MIFSILVVHLLKCWPVTKYFVPVLLKKCAKGFPASLKNAKPHRGTYLPETVEGTRCFVFHDRREVCFVTNVFSKRMDAPVARL